jgi:hypothetical protein
MVSLRNSKYASLKSDLLVKGGQWKPNQYFPLPKQVSFTRSTQGKFVCPGSLFQTLHRVNSAAVEYYEMATNFPQAYDEAEQSIHNMQEFDAATNILVIIAHDCAPLDPRSGFKFFPTGTLNDWKKEKLDESIRWAFLDDFTLAVQNGMQQETKKEGGLTFRPQ